LRVSVFTLQVAACICAADLSFVFGENNSPWMDWNKASFNLTGGSISMAKQHNARRVAEWWLDSIGSRQAVA
jgi:hypothetical protein